MLFSFSHRVQTKNDDRRAGLQRRSLFQDDGSDEEFFEFSDTR